MHHLPHVLAAFAAATALACGKAEAPKPPPPAEQPASAEPTEGAARIAIAPDGVHVQYRVYGSGEPTLVFIHDWSGDSNYWREQIPVFKAKYTLVTVDLAGHGGTDANRTEWSIPRFGQDVATALAAVPGAKLVLIGHGMGGPVALEAARLLEARTLGIIGVDTFKSIGAPRPSNPQIDAVMQPFESDFIGHTRGLVARQFFAVGAPPALVQKVAYDLSLSPERVAVPAMRALLSYDFSGTLKEVAVPIVAINSDLGEPLNEARIRRVLPRFRSVTLPGTGHFLMMEVPGSFNAVLETEIQALPGAGS